MNDIKGVWQDISADIKQEIGLDDYIRWFKQITPLRYEDSSFILGVSNDFFACWFLNQFKNTIDEKLAIYYNKPVCVICEVSDEKTLEKKNCISAKNNSLNKKISTRPKRKTKAVKVAKDFDSFVVGDNSDLAYAFAMMIAENPHETEANPFFIYGKTGLGKTHLLNSIANKAKELDSSLQIKYMPSDAFANEYIKALTSRKLSDFREKYRMLDVLLIDDVQFFAKKEKIQEEFFHTFNDLVQQGKQIILSSDKMPRELRGLEKRLVSRFVNGQIVEITSPDYETRLAILNKKIEEKNFTLTEDVLEYIAQNIKSNVRPLEGAINRLSFFQSLKMTTITLDKCQELIANFIDSDKLQSVDVKYIVEEVARFYDISVEEILKKNKKSSIATIRQIAMYLSRTMTDQSLPSIGEKFRRNHSTISYACKTVENRLKHDKELQRSIDNIKEAIK